MTSSLSDTHSLTEYEEVEDGEITTLVNDKTLKHSTCVSEPMYSAATPLHDTCIWTSGQTRQRDIPSVAELQRKNNEVMSSLHGSVSRLRQLTRTLSDAESINNRPREYMYNADRTYNGPPVRGDLVRENVTALPREALAFPAGQQHTADGRCATNGAQRGAANMVSHFSASTEPKSLLYASGMQGGVGAMQPDFDICDKSSNFQYEQATGRAVVDTSRYHSPPVDHSCDFRGQRCLSTLRFPPVNTTARDHHFYDCRERVGDVGCQLGISEMQQATSAKPGCMSSSSEAECDDAMDWPRYKQKQTRKPGFLQKPHNRHESDELMDAKLQIAKLNERLKQLETPNVAKPVTVGDERSKVSKVVKVVASSSDSESEPACVRYIKPAKFDGTGSFETFLAQFQNCITHNRWSISEQLAQLKACLTKEAAQVLWDSTPETVDTYDKLIDLLKNRFSGTRQSDKYRIELRIRRRKPNESLSVLHQDIRRLIALAHPDFPAAAREVMASDYFIDSLGDPMFALKIRERNPASLDEALRVALQIEAWQKDAERHKELYGDEQARQKSKSTRTTKVSDDRVAALQSELTEMRRKFAELEARQPSVATPQQAQMQPVWPAQPQASVPTTAGTNGLTSSTVGFGNSSNDNTQRRPPRACFNCGDPSHFRNRCPMLFQSGSTARPLAPPAAEAQNRASASCEGGRVYLTVKFKGKPLDCLLDTGSEVTLMPQSLCAKYKNLKMQEADKRVYAANATEIEIVGKAVVPLHIQNKCVFAEAYITPDIEEVMLGIDFLSKNKCCWDFHRNCITIQGVVCVLSCRSSAALCRRIYAVQDTLVPARHQANVVVRATLNSLHDSSDSWVTEPRTLQPGIYVSQSLVPDRHKNIVVRVVNTTDEPRLIKQHTFIASAEPAIVPVQCKPEMEPGEHFASRKLLDKLPVELSVDQRTQISALLTKYETAFSQHEYDIGKTHLVEHSIDTGSHRPIRQPLRRHPAAHLDIIDNQVNEMLKFGVIEPAASPWSSNVVLARKKDGSMRLCIDYRKINQITYQDTYPLPHIDTCLTSLQGSSWFSTLDLSSGYYNVPIRECDKDKTCFVTRRGAWRFNVLPFGLTCAPSVFQRLMDLVLSGLSYEICLAYIDDIIIFASTFEQHLERLEQVLSRILKAGLKLKASKCYIFQRRTEFLGHIISGNGIEVQPSKISAVTEWPTPANLHDVRSFIGLCSYYRRFVPGFAKVAAPLHELMRKHVRFFWGPAQEDSFNKLKECLVSAPVLAMPRDDGEYILDTDACDIGLGAVLSQVQDGIERPIAYASRSLNKQEKNYCTTRKELLAVVYGLKQYKHYVLGRPLRIRSDHSALMWLKRTSEPVAQQARWLEFIEQFQYTIEHRPGHRHGNADSLSRRPVECRQCGHCGELEEKSDETAYVRAAKAKANEIMGSVVEGQAREDLAQMQQTDPELGPIIRMRLAHDQPPCIEQLSQESEITKTLHAQWFRLTIKDGIVYRIYFSKQCEPNRLQLLVPKKLRAEILDKCHAGLAGGHLGIKKTCDQVQRRAFWPGWRGDTIRYCKRCVNCITYHRGKLSKQGPLQPVIAGAPMERLAIDLSGPHPRTPRGSVYIMACIDTFTKWAEAFPLPNKEAATVARVLVEQVFCRFGSPLSLLSDQGTEVDSTIMREVCKLLDIDKMHTTSYKPSTNPTERLNKTLNAMIGRVVNERQTDWDLLLPYIMAAVRNARQESTNYTPNFLMLGREVRVPVDFLLGEGNSPEHPVTYDDFVENVRERMLSAHDLVRQHLGKAAQRNKRQYDLRMKEAKFKPNDLVYYYNPRKIAGKQDKWRRLFTGPYTVIKQLGPVNYQIQKSTKSKPFVVHVDKLKVCPPVELDNTQQALTNENEQSVVETPDIDVVTFNTDQEFRRNRPRRSIKIPRRYL